MTVRKTVFIVLHREESVIREIIREINRDNREDENLRDYQRERGRYLIYGQCMMEFSAPAKPSIPPGLCLFALSSGRIRWCDLL